VDLVQAIVYGIIQGLTEFLPVSSTAHLRIAPALLGWTDPGAAFTAVIQLGTILAVLIYFAKDLGKDVSAWASSIKDKSKRETPEAKMGWAVFWGSIPVAVLGVLLHSKIETTFRSLYVIAFSMIVMGVVMLLAEQKGKRNRDVAQVEVQDGVTVGIWQVLALFPGMSRSGSTISGALFRGFDHAAAAKFSFLLSIPSITAAGLFEAFQARKELSGIMMPTIVSTVVSFIVGYVSIAFFMNYLKKRGIGPFVIYRIVLGVALIALIQAKVLKPDEGAKPLKTEVPVASATIK